MTQALDDDGGPSAEDRIEAALEAATETSRSPAHTLTRVMGALGYDFGDPEDLDRSFMQLYGDIDKNPFIRAMVEARTNLDVGAMEKLAVAFKHQMRKSPDGASEFEANMLVAQAEGLAQMAKDDPDEALSADALAHLMTRVLFAAFARHGVDTFNLALDKAATAIFDSLV